MSSIPPVEPDFTLPSQMDRSPGGTGGGDPGYVPGVEFDGAKRYLLPVPGGDPSELEPWTRVTTLTGALTSQEGLRVWSERNIVRGIGLRPDLRAAIASDPNSKEVQDEVRRTAKVVTGDGADARHGRAVHRAVEKWSVGGALPANLSPEEELGRDALAAIQCLQENGIRVRMVERVVVHDVCRYAGRLDALWEVTLPDGRTVLRIGDVKTGKDLHKPEKRHPMGAQLGGYVNATHMYDQVTRTFSPMPSELDRTVGYILSVRNGTAQLYEIDLVAGWQRMLTAIKLHRDRRASVDMLPVGQPVVISAPAAGGRTPNGAVTTTTTDAVTALLAGAERASAIIGDALAPYRPAAPLITPNRTVTAEQATAGPEFYLPHLSEDVSMPSDTMVMMTTPGPGETFDPARHAVVIQNVGTEHATTDVPAPAEPERSPSGRRRRTCSKCRRPGHTAKNCPGIPEEDSATFPQARPQDGDTAAMGSDVVDQEPTATAVKIRPPMSVDDMLTQDRACPGTCNAGWSVPPWTSRPDLTVCGACGLPSSATLEKIRGERAGMRSLSSPAPAASAQPLPPTVESGATVARLDPPPAPVPPWQAVQVPDAPPSLMDLLAAVRSQEELGQLWQAHQQEWGVEHTAEATRLVDGGLPVLPPE